MRLLRCLAALLLVAATVTACKSKKPDAEPAPASVPPRAVDAGAPSTRDPRPVAHPVVPLGEPFSADPAAAAGEPDLVVDADGKPVMAWIEAGVVQVRRWNGTAWDLTGPSPNQATRRAQGVPALAVEADGGLLLGWRETSARDVDMLQVARWKDGAWTALGELGNGKPVEDPSLAASALGPVAVWREADDKGNVAVLVRALGAQGWAPVGEGVLRLEAEGTTRVAPALATRPGGAVVVGWIERAPTPRAAVRRWDPAKAAWEELPELEGADGDSTLALAQAPDGTLYAGVSFNAGLNRLVFLAPGAAAWKPIDVPELANGHVSRHQFTVGDDGRAVFTYPFGGRFAWWDGKAWTALAVPVMAPSTVVPAAAVGKDGFVYVAWTAAKPGGTDKVRAYSIK